jgi:hypothetical protein
MIPASQNFVESLSDDVQVVKPSVKAWMADYRYLENLTVHTSSHTYSKQILDRSPKIYFKLDKTDYNTVYNKISATISIANPAVITSNGHKLNAGTPVTFSTTGALPTGITAGTTYYVQNPLTNTFNINTIQANSLNPTLSTGRVVTSGTQSGSHSVTYYLNRVKDLGDLHLEAAYGNSTSGSPVQNTNLSFESYGLTDYDGTNKNIEILNPKRVIDTFNYHSFYELGPFYSPSVDMSMYSWRTTLGSQWGSAWIDNSDIFYYKPVYLYHDTMTLDHFVDFKLGTIGSSFGGVGAIVRFIDDENFIYCRQRAASDATSGTMAIYKVINGTHTLVKSIDSVRFSASNFYRFESKYNTFTLYNMGTTEPTNTSAGTVLSNGGVNLTCYIDDEIFRSPEATQVGLLNAGIKTYNSSYTRSFTIPRNTFSFSYFGCYGFNFLSGSHYFDGSKYVLVSSSDTQNSKDKFSSINNAEDFSYSFIFKKLSGGASIQTLLWLGDNLSNTALRISHSTSTNRISVRVIDNATNNEYSISSSSTISNDTLYYVQLAKNGDSLELYVNGVLDGTALLPSNFSLKDVSTNNTTYLLLGADYARTSFGESDSYRLFYGYISELAVFDYNVNSFDSLSMFNSINNDSTLPSETSDKYFVAENTVDGLPEETFLYGFTNFLNSKGNAIRSNNTTFAPELKIESDENQGIEDNYGWMSRCQSDSSGDFSTSDHIILEFDNHYCNRVFLSTGYLYGRINDFDYIIYKSDLTTISGSSSFGGESYIYIEPEDLGLFVNEYLEIVGIKIIPTSTINPYDYARLFSINPIWEVDFSDYVISFNIDKVRDNFDASLPIGATAANNGSIELNNTDLIFNPYGNSLFGQYINPDTKFFISLEHELLKYGTTEIVPIALEMYADTWSISTSGMSVSVDLRDYSKFLQEGTVKGYVSQGLTAGKSIHDLVISSGFPNRRISFFDKYREEISSDEPDVWLTLTEPTFRSSIAYSDDQCNRVYGYNSSYLSAEYGSSIIYSDVLSAQDDTSRIIDELSVDTYNPTYKTSSLNPNGTIDLYRTDVFGRWAPDQFDFFTFGIVSYVKDPDTLAAGSYYDLFTYKVPSTSYGMYLQYKKSEIDNSKIVFKFYFVDSAGTTFSIESGSFDITKPHIIYVAKGGENEDEYRLYVDGYERAAVTTPQIPFAGSGGTPRFLVGSAGSAFLSNFTYFDYCLTDERIFQHYATSQFSIIPTFNLLYAKDQTYWDAVLNIATADLGMFYIDEYGDFKYEYRNVLHDAVNDRYQNSQYTFSDDINIIDGSLASEVQTNKVNVKINTAKASSSGFQNLWSAEEGESLVVSSIVDNIYPNSTSIEVKNTTNPQFLASGYVKIDDEIIKYGGLANNVLLNIQRGMFGTPISWHSAGSRVREARHYNIEYSSSPAVSVRYPFITQYIYEDTVSIDRYSVGASSTEIVVSAKDPGLPVLTESGVDYYFRRAESVSNILILQGSDPLTGVNNSFVISGIPVSSGESQETVTEYSAQMLDNIRKYRLKELDINNDFIGNKIYAQIVADHVIGYYSDPIKIMNFEIHGVPTLQLGDLITVSKFEKIGIIDQDFWVIQSTLSYDGGIKQTLSVREYSPTIPAPELKFI